MQQPIPRKSLGQHWLKDQTILNKIVDYSNPSLDDCVLEIGPGTGNLTQILITKVGKVIAVELDEALYIKLMESDHSSNIEYINQDILKFDLNKLPKGYKIVANIPYYLSGHLIRILTESNNKPKAAVLLVQKEVAQRVSAKPGSMSVISVVVQQYFDVSLGDIVLAKMFTPPPKVDSQIIILSKRHNPLIDVDDQDKFIRLIKIGFSARRKTLENSLSNGLRQDKMILKSAISNIKLDPLIRPQMLSLNDWGNLYKELRDSF